MNKEVEKMNKRLARMLIEDKQNMKEHFLNKIEQLQAKVNQLETNIEKAINILEDLRKFVRSEDDYIMGGAEIISELTSTINILKGSDK